MAEVSTRSGGGGRIPPPPAVVASQIVGPEIARERSPYEVLGFIEPSQQTIEAIRIVANLYTDDGKLLVDIDLDNPLWSDRDKLTRALHAQSRLSEFITRSKGSIDLEKLSELDFERIGAKLEAYKEKGSIKRMFDKSFQEYQQVLAKVMSVPEELDEVIKCVATLKDIQGLVDEAAGNRRIWSKLLGQTPTVDEKRDPRFWQKSSQFILALADFVARTQDNPDAPKLRKLLFSPKAVYRAFD